MGGEEKLPNHFSTGNLPLRYSGVNLFMKGRVNVLFQLFIPCFTRAEALVELSSCSVHRFSDERLNIKWGFKMLFIYFLKKCYDYSNFMRGSSVQEAAVRSNQGTITFLNIVRKSLEYCVAKRRAQICSTHSALISL